jgi:hypothetical protein
MPGMMIALFPMEVLQTRGQLTIVQEAFSQIRRIYIGEDPPAIEDAEPTFFGHSGAKWEGDTLVVETVAIKESVLSYQGLPHSDQMRITERLRLVAKDILHDQITIADPVVLESPVVYTLAYRRQPDYKMVEFVCENNREYIDENGRVRMRLRDK